MAGANIYIRVVVCSVEDCVAFAMQEIMRIFDVHLDNDDSSSITTIAGGHQKPLWKQFSSEVKEILMPLTHSRCVSQII